jgi:hypothetical protein
MADSKQNSTSGKKPLSPHLFVGARGTVDDVRVSSGYPIWNLVAAWIMAGEDDRAPIAEYGISAQEWQAAKQYYLEHKPIFDARIITNSQPAADDDVPPISSVEDYFAWLRREGLSDASHESLAHG